MSHSTVPIRKGSWGVSVVPLAVAARRPLKDGHSVRALDWTMALAAYTHSLLVIVTGCILLLSLAPSWREWRMTNMITSLSIISSSSHSSTVSTSPLVTAATNSVHHLHQHQHHPHPSTLSDSSLPVTPVWWLSSPTTSGQTILFCLSTTYFILDLIALYWRTRFQTSKGQRICIHHLLSIAGLLGPIITGLDGPIVLVGLLLAESSNPPAHVLTLCKYATKSNMRIRLNSSAWLKRFAKPILYMCVSMDLSLVHVLIFVLTRLACFQFTAHVVMPFSLLLSTKITSIILCILSAIMFLDVCKTVQLGDPTHGPSKRQGWKEIVGDLRELQTECECDTTALLGTSSSSTSPQTPEVDGPDSHGPRKRFTSRGSGGGSGSNSGSSSPKTAPTSPKSPRETITQTTSRKSSVPKKLIW